MESGAPGSGAGGDTGAVNWAGSSSLSVSWFIESVMELFGKSVDP